jgi:hypothetical protein
VRIVRVGGIDIGMTWSWPLHASAGVDGGSGRPVAPRSSPATGDGELLAVLDDADRVHLPRELAELFPGRRLRLAADGDHLRIDPP